MTENYSAGAVTAPAFKGIVWSEDQERVIWRCQHFHTDTDTAEACGQGIIDLVKLRLCTLGVDREDG